MKSILPLYNRLFRLSSLLVLLLPVRVAAQSGEALSFVHISVDEGLSSSVVLDVYQDRAGFMWFGTDDGLNRYDGYAFEHFVGAHEALSSTTVTDVYEDENGRMWLASARGAGYLCPNDDDYHPVVNDLNCNILFPLDSSRLLVGTSGGLRIVQLADLSVGALTTDDGLPANQIVGIVRDGSGATWVLFPGGLARYDVDHDRLQDYRTVNPSPGQVANWKALAVDARGQFWLASDHELVAYSATGPGRVERTVPLYATATNSKRTFFVAHRGSRILVGTDRGLFSYDRSGDTLRQYLKGEGQHGLNNNEVRCFFADRQGGTWLGTYGGGVNYSSPYNATFDHFNRELGPAGGGEHIISGFADDGRGKLWLTSWGDGLLYYDRAQAQHGTYRFPDGRFSDEVFRSVAIQDDLLWLATNHNGLVRLNPLTGQYRHFAPTTSGLGSLQVYDTHVGLGEVWFGLGGGAEGLQRYDARLQEVVTVPLRSPLNQQPLRYVRAIADDGKGRLFLGTHGQGLWVYRPEDGTVEQFSSNSSPQLSDDVVYSLSYDPAGYLWVGTMVGGLNLIHLATGRVLPIGRAQGLPNNCINGILPDGNGNLWLSTNRGLVMFRPPAYVYADTSSVDYVRSALTEEDFVHFSVEDGLQSNEFKYGSYYRGPEGMLYFGGINGYNRFDPREVRPNPLPPPVVITDIEVFDRDAWPQSRHPEIAITPGGRASIELPHNQNLLTIDYAALNYSQSSKNRYAYYLDGFDHDWRYVNDLRTASYTNLPPGNYTFRVKAANNSGVWNEAGASLDVAIIPPIWARSWFQLLAVIGVVSLLYLYYRYRLRVEKRKTQRLEAAVHRRTHELGQANLQLQEQSTEIERAWGRVHAADQDKLRFFTNVSHEFRTPLTLIIGPLEDLIQGNRTTMDRGTTLRIMHKNAVRLLRLINELLDLRTLDTGASRLQVQHLDLAQFLRSIVANFRYQTDLKSIDLVVHLPEAIPLWVDPEKLEKVFFNLLGNALKFTGEGGQISLSSEVSEEEVRITVRNSGAYIPPDRLPHIFDRYVKSPEERSHEGNGIGLALVRELIGLHRGRIEVRSQPDWGTEFTVLLPRGLAPYTAAEISERNDYELGEVYDLGPVEPAAVTSTDTTEAPAERNERPILLVAEDDPDLRVYLESLFTGDYTVLSAANGQLALELTRQHVPDFVISDFMMPELDGLQLCEALKSDATTSHIPIIMVTARTVEEDQLAGLRVGVDDYITKPFSSRALRLKVGNILERRRAMQERLQDISQIYQVNPQNETETTFYKQLIEAIEANLSDEAFNTTALAEALNMSRSQLYRKILAVVNRPASELIREVRMKHAEAKLLHTDEQVSTIAYSLGFKNVSHFSKAFSATYGVPPTKFRSQGAAAR